MTAPDDRIVWRDAARKRVEARGYQDGELQLKWRTAPPETYDPREAEDAILEALNREGVIAWPGDAVSCVEQIVTAQAKRADHWKTKFQRGYDLVESALLERNVRLDAMISAARDALFKQWRGGTRVTNCVAHMHRPWDQRPEDCTLCRTDIQNQLMYAIRVNEWLNQRLDAAREVLGSP